MKSPIEDLVKALKEDEGYRDSWVANIAMAVYDAARNTKKPLYTLQDLHKAANEGG